MNNAVRIAALALVLSGCENPATDKPAAEVGDARSATAQGEGMDRLAIDPATSKVEWEGSKVTGSHDGGFKEFTGFLAYDEADPTKSSVELEVDTTSIWSDTEKLTKHLKSADFFEVEKFPTATFTSTSIVKGEGENEYDITGNLELHGVTKSITFPATVSETDGSVSAKSEFAINRKDFDINYKGAPNDLIRDEVVIKLDVNAKRDAEEATSGTKTADAAEEAKAEKAEAK